MSSGVSGVSGAGGVGGASSGGSSGGGVGGGVAKVNGAAGATSVGKGKGATVTEGNGNMVGNSQTQNITHNEFHNHYGMSTQDFCSTRSMGGSNETQSLWIAQADPEQHPLPEAVEEEQSEEQVPQHQRLKEQHQRPDQGEQQAQRK